LRDETLVAANALLISAQNDIPLPPETAAEHSLIRCAARLSVMMSVP
jgi:hypothetical protein